MFLWDRLAKAQPAAASTRFLEDFVPKPATAAASPTDAPMPAIIGPVQGARGGRGRRGPPGLLKKKQGPGAGGAVEQVQAGVAAAVASVVGSAVPEDQPLMDAGLDSLGASQDAKLWPAALLSFRCEQM